MFSAGVVMFFERRRESKRAHALLFLLAATVGESRNRLPSGPYGTEKAGVPKWRRS